MKKSPQFAALAAGVLVFLISDFALAASYTATLLHPLSGFFDSFGVELSGQSQVGYARALSNNFHALWWEGTPESAVDLHPAGFEYSYANGASGGIQVGVGSGIATGLNSHALLWSGTAGSVVDLHPTGFDNSSAIDVAGINQVGYGTVPAGSGSDQHALLWSGTAESAIDLHPTGFRSSLATGVSESHQVGYGVGANASHALLWSGTADRVVDLHPSDFAYSAAISVSGNSQVGRGAGDSTAGQEHALLWNGNANSVVDLNPPGYRSSIAEDVVGSIQVGWGGASSTRFYNHALVWNSTAESAVDLHAFLAGLPVTLVESYALGVEPNGMIVGYALDSGGTRRAILWTPVPEPNGLTIVGFGLIGAALRRPQRLRVNSKSSYAASPDPAGAICTRSGSCVYRCTSRCG